jgi:hypothetical protein
MAWMHTWVFANGRAAPRICRGVCCGGTEGDAVHSWQALCRPQQGGLACMGLECAVRVYLTRS